MFFLWVVLTIIAQLLLKLTIRDIKLGNQIIKLTITPSMAIIVLTITALALILTTSAVLTNTKNVPLSGTINAVNLGVYSDSECTQTVTTLTVGALNATWQKH